MEERLQAILARIDASKLSQDEKVKLYGIIAEGLKASIWPVLSSAMPKDALANIAKHPSDIAVKEYMTLLDEATKDGTVLDEVETTLLKLLDEVDAALREENI